MNWTSFLNIGIPSAIHAASPAFWRTPNHIPDSQSIQELQIQRHTFFNPFRRSIILHPIVREKMPIICSYIFSSQFKRPGQFGKDIFILFVGAIRVRLFRPISRGLYAYRTACNRFCCHKPNHAPVLHRSIF